MIRMSNFAQTSDEKRRAGAGRLISLVSGFLLALTAIPAAQAQTARPCSSGKKLTLTAVEGYITQKKDEITIRLIQNCHVSFPLNAPSLQEPVHAGVSEAVMDALNRDTAAQLTAEQAHIEVAGLQANPGDAQVQRAFQARTAFLKNAEYAVAGAFRYQNYESAVQVLDATIGDDEYTFRPVTSSAAQQLSSNPRGIAITRHYEDDKMRQRIVRLASAQIEITGNSKQAMVHDAVVYQTGEMNDALQKGRDTFTSGDYDAAANDYAAAMQAADGAQMLNRSDKDAADRQNLESTIDTGKKEAMDGLAKAANAKGEGQKCTLNGMWCVAPGDSQGVMWTLKDNGEDISAHEAEGYCKALHTGNYSDWRLPTVLDLKGIFDPSANRNTPPTTRVIHILNNGAFETLPKGTVWQYHIKGGIQLTATKVWSSSQDEASAGSKWAYMDFQDGNGYRRKASDKELLRALCIRGTSSMQTTADTSGIGGERIDGSQAGQQGPADTWTDQQTHLTWTIKDNGRNVNWNMARDYCQALRTAGFSDWRLASREELKNIYDASADPEISDWKRHTKGGIALTGAVVWSGTRDNTTVFGEGAVWVKFSDGSDFTDRIAAPARALCVRSANPQAEAAPPKQPAAATMASEPLSAADQIERQGEALYLDNRFNDAFPLAKQSCDAGSQDGCGLEAAMYGMGAGIKQDLTRAEMLAKHACDAGSSRGCEVLGSAYNVGIGVGKNQFRAAELFKSSCNGGFVVACYDLGMLTMDGSGVPKDMPRGLQLLRQACTAGFVKSCQELNTLHAKGA